MINKLSKIPLKDIRQHETKQHVLFKFLFVILILIGYLILMSTKYGLEQGILVTMLTWSFFVICTPIADAGFLIDFPMRIVLRIRMLYSEIAVWLIAIGLNIYAFIIRPEIYDTTHLLSVFKKILINPFPFWGIIVISAIGTFLSVHFGDELINKVKHSERTVYNKHKYNHRFIIMIFIFGMSYILYTILIKQLGIESLV